MNKYTHTHIYIYIYIHACIYIHTYICIYTHTHTHTYIGLTRGATGTFNPPTRHTRGNLLKNHRVALARRQSRP